MFLESNAGRIAGPHCAEFARSHLKHAQKAKPSNVARVQGRGNSHSFAKVGKGVGTLEEQSYISEHMPSREAALACF